MPNLLSVSSSTVPNGLEAARLSPNPLVGPANQATQTSNTGCSVLYIAIDLAEASALGMGWTLKLR